MNCMLASTWRGEEKKVRSSYEKMGAANGHHGGDQREVPIVEKMWAANGHHGGDQREVGPDLSISRLREERKPQTDDNAKKTPTP